MVHHKKEKLTIPNVSKENLVAGCLVQWLEAQLQHSEFEFYHKLVTSKKLMHITINREGLTIEKVINFIGFDKLRISDTFKNSLLI